MVVVVINSTLGKKSRNARACPHQKETALFTPLLARRGRRVGLEIAAPVLDPRASSRLSVYTFDAADPHRRRLAARAEWPHTPYLHSFGALHDAALLPIQPLAVSTAAIAEGRPMRSAFTATSPATT